MLSLTNLYINASTVIPDDIAKLKESPPNDVRVTPLSAVPSTLTNSKSVLTNWVCIIYVSPTRINNTGFVPFISVYLELSFNVFSLITLKSV